MYILGTIQYNLTHIETVFWNLSFQQYTSIWLIHSSFDPFLHYSIHSFIIRFIHHSIHPFIIRFIWKCTHASCIIWFLCFPMTIETPRIKITWHVWPLIFSMASFMLITWINWIMLFTTCGEGPRESRDVRIPLRGWIYTILSVIWSEQRDFTTRDTSLESQVIF